MRELLVTDLAKQIKELDASDLLSLHYDLTHDDNGHYDVISIRNNKEEIELHLGDDEEVIKAVSELDLAPNELFWFDKNDNTVGNEDEQMPIDSVDLEALADVLEEEGGTLAENYGIALKSVTTLEKYLRDNIEDLPKDDLLAIFEEYFSDSSAYTSDEDDDYVFFD